MVNPKSRTVYRLTTVLLTLLLLLAVTTWIQPTVKAAETTTATKRYALSFDGEDDYVDVGDPEQVRGLRHITIEVMWKPLSARYHRLVAKWDSDKQEFIFYPYDNRRVVFHVSVGGTWYDVKSLSTYDINAWETWYGVYDDGILRIYKNGVFDNEEDTGITGAIDYKGSLLGIGTSPGTRIYLMHGYVALVRIYSRALSASEIQHNYLNPTSINTSGLVLWLQPVVDWTRDPPEVLDFSGNGNNGKLYGATLVEADSDSVPPIVIPAGFVLQTYNVSWSEGKVFNWVNITSTGVWADGNKTYTENVIQLTYTKYYEKTATNRYEHTFTITKKTLPETSVIKFSNPITSDYLKVYVDNSEVLELDEYDFEKSRTPCWHRESGEIWVKVSDNSTVQVVWENKTETIGGGGGGGIIVPPTTTTTTTTTSTTSIGGAQPQPSTQTPISPIPPIHEVLKPIIEFLARLLPFSGIQVSEAPRLPLNLNPILVALLFASCLGLAYMLTMSGGSKRGRKTGRRSRRTSTRRGRRKR
ncbi:MAG: hypothetical protein DRO09_02095 [Thermoprotei archaeon]|nr:MAG: hypothetical protein DRO09_02095 [Thermoprotei archaeon]